VKALALFLTLALATAMAAPKHIVFVLGDHEYSGEQTLPILARELEKSSPVRCTILKSVPDQNGETDIPGLEALRSADLAVFCLRWRRLPQRQLTEIERYVKAGKPVLGLRTTSHSFRYPPGDPLESWNAWGSAAFGTPPGWGGDGHTHFGHQASTDVAIAPAAKGDPLLKGVAERFHVRSWLYRVLPKWPPADAKVLLIGTAVDPNKPAEPNPVAWTWKNKFGGRAFYTSMGHPEDFEVESFQRLLVNAIAWCLDTKPVWKGKMEIHVPYRGMVSSSSAK
jgi:type 1 glutamine amidotransferase